MFPNSQQIGIRISQEEAAAISDAHLTANRYINHENLPDSIVGTNFRLPGPGVNGEIVLDEDLAQSAANIAFLATKASERNFERHKDEYKHELDKGDNLFLEFLQDGIREQYAKMIAFKGLATAIAENLEQSQSSIHVATGDF